MAADLTGAERAGGVRGDARLAYRPEIDGLRALAVLAVVFYHAGWRCPGGFVGVDVFFVISGYLITALLVRDLKAGTFSLAGFWERRVRRIFPALTVMVAATLVAGFFLPLASDFARLGQSSVAQSLMSANLYFWRQPGGYFALNTDFSPLLHTWSLAVEEQFYVVFPLVLLLFRGRISARPRWLRIGVWLGLAASLVLAAVLLPSMNRLVFYSLPTRAWELLCGALLAAGPAAGFRGGRWLKEVVAWAGLAAILLPVWLYTNRTPFPGLAALLPCGGAMAFIWANARETAGSAPTRAGRLLAVRPLVFIGLISYSLYLWHWPVMVYAYYGTMDLVVPSLGPIPVLVSAGLAVVSWRWIERPFREKRIAGTRRALFTLAATATAAVLVVAGAALWKGRPSALTQAARANEAALKDKPRVSNTTIADVRAGRIPRLGSQAPGAPLRVLVWGDSHAKHAVPALDELLGELGVRGEVISFAATLPVNRSFAARGELRDQVPAWFEAVLRHVRETRVKNVILTACWSGYGQAEPEALEAAVAETLRRLEELGCRVWVVRAIPVYDVVVPRALAGEGRPWTWGPSGEWRKTEAEHRRKNAVMERLAARSGLSAVFLDPAPALLEAGARFYRVEEGGVSLYSDNNHLTKRGAQRVLYPLFRDALTEALKEE